MASSHYLPSTIRHCSLYQSYSNTNHTTVLWSPDLGLVVAGDSVYNGAFQYIIESPAPDDHEAWRLAVDSIKALKPTSVMTGHWRAAAVSGAWTLEPTDAV